MVRTCVVGVVLAVLAASGAAQEPVPIKFADAKAGDRVKVTEEESSRAVTAVQANGKEQKKEDRGSKLLVYTEETVTPGEGPGKRPLKLTRTYEKVSITKNGKGEDAGAVGKTVLIEKRDGKYQFTIDGAKLTGPLAADLEKAFNRADGPGSRALFPAEPVKPGAAWKIDPKKALADLPGDMKFDLDSATVGGSLVRAFQQDGATFGAFEIKAELPIKSLGDKSPLALKPSSVLNMTVTGTGNIDGTLLAGTMTTKMRIKIEGTTQGLDLTVTADVEQKKTSEPLPKK